MLHCTPIPIVCCRTHRLLTSLDKDDSGTLSESELMKGIEIVQQQAFIDIKEVAAKQPDIGAILAESDLDGACLLT